jgi:hypothetical protein
MQFDIEKYLPYLDERDDLTRKEKEDYIHTIWNFMDCMIERQFEVPEDADE